MQITPGNSHAPCMQPLPCDPCTWLFHVTLARGFCAAQLNLRTWVNWTLFHSFARSTTFSEHQRFVVSAHDVSRDFFRLWWAFPSINLVYLLLSWLFYNSKSSKPNTSASPFGRRNRRLLVSSSELSIPLVQWPDLVLARVLIGTFFLPTKMSSLKLLPLRAVALPHQPAVSRAPIPHSAIAMTGTDARSSLQSSTDKQWLLWSYCWYFSYFYSYFRLRFNCSS